jgi:hypothetical protein
VTEMTADEPIVMRAWVATDLLRVLTQARMHALACLGENELFHDLTYHAGLLHLRLDTLTKENPR